jgi:hypothetical protein
MKTKKVELTIKKTFKVPNHIKIEKHPEHGIHFVNEELGIDYYPEVELFRIKEEESFGNKHYSMEPLYDEFEHSFWFYDTSSSSFSTKSGKTEINFSCKR